MTQKQKLTLLDDIGENSWPLAVSFTDEYIFVPLGDFRFVFAERDGDYTFRVALSGQRTELAKKDPFSGEQVRWTTPQVSWDGNRLALITAVMRNVPVELMGGYRYDTCGFAIEVFTENRLDYMGIYDSSLDVLAALDDNRDRCNPIGHGSLSASWGNYNHN